MAVRVALQAKTHHHRKQECHTENTRPSGKDTKQLGGTYDPTTKTIEVYFTDEEMKQKTNYGNRYQIGSYYFLIEVPEGKGKNGWAHGKYVLEFKAKNEANAERNAKKWAKGLEYIVIREATLDEYISRKEFNNEKHL